MSRLYINGVDVASDFLWWVDEAPGFDAGPTMTQELLAVPGRFGGIPSGVLGTAARTVRFGGVIAGSGISDTRTRYDGLVSVASAGLVTLVWDSEVYGPRQIRGYLTALERPRYFGNPLVQHAARVDLVFTCPDGAWRSVELTTLALSATRVRCPLGTAPSAPLCYVYGNGSSPTSFTLVVRNAAGDAVSTTTLTGTALGANDFLEVDAGAQTIVKSASGVRSNGIAYYASGPWPKLDPADGRYDLSIYPTLEVTANAGTAAGAAIYGRHWL
jgi:hypothetical protein